MTKISQYSTDVNITGNDKWIGSDAQNFLITKNFTPNNLATYFNGNNVIDIGTSIRYVYQTLNPGEAREQGTISFETEVGPQVNFSDITTFLIAKNTLKGNTVTQYLDFLVGGSVLLSRANNINTFGYYKITDIEPWIPNTNFFVVTVDFLSGNGFIYEDLDYLVSLVDKNQGGSTTTWGSITGDIEDQTDLIGYISSQITTPNLQEVTDELLVFGAAPTTNDMLFLSNTYSNSITRIGSNNPDGGYAIFTKTGTGASQTFINANQVSTPKIYINSLLSGQSASIHSDYLTDTRNYQLPDESGTIALASDIPTLTSELTNDSGFLTQQEVLEFESLADIEAVYPTGTAGVVYVATNVLTTGVPVYYIWNGTAYVTTAQPVTGITGIGNTNIVPKFTSPTSIGNSGFSEPNVGGIYGKYINGAQYLEFARSGEILGLFRAQSNIKIQLGVPLTLPTTITSSQNTEGLHIASVGDFVLKTGNPLAIAYNVNRANRNIHIGAATDTDYATQKLQVTGNLRVTGGYYDSSNNIGTSGQVLSSTVTGTAWIAAPSGGVPYTGAISDVNLGEFGLLTGNIEFDNTPTNIPTGAGSLYYNDTDGTLDLILKGGNIKLQVGQESVIRVVNKTATNINLLEANYQAVRVTGAQGQRLKVDLAQATTDALSAETIGLVTETINNNQEGFITTSGLVRNINTTGSLQGETWADGDVLYLSPTVAGRVTKIKPTAPNHLVIIGYVIHAHATQGSIFVKVDNGYELDELHNVKITGATNNQALTYTSATDIWENKTIIEDAIVNGVLDKAPSQNSVFDGLALKQNATIKVGYLTNTGVTGQTVIASLLIPANWLENGDGFEIIFTPHKSVTAANMSFNMYHDTVLNGITNVIATNSQLSTAQRTGYMQRILSLDGTTLRNSMIINVSSNIPISSNSVGSTTTFNPTVNNYITITANPTVILDTFGVNQIFIRKL